MLPHNNQSEQILCSASFQTSVTEIKYIIMERAQKPVWADIKRSILPIKRGFIRSIPNWKLMESASSLPPSLNTVVLQQKHHRTNKSPAISYTCNFSATCGSVRLTFRDDRLVVRSGDIIHKKQEKTIHPESERRNQDSCRLDGI